MPESQPSKEDLEGLKAILTLNREPEVLCSSIIENKTNKGNTQFKVTIPKKFAEALQLNKTDFEMVFFLEKTIIEGKLFVVLHAEVAKKNDE